MFIHTLDGSWFDHPFWRSKFLLRDASLLDDLHASDVGSVVIDISKGNDVRPVTLATARPLSIRREGIPFKTAQRCPSKSAPAPENPAVDLRSTAPQTMAREFGLAKQVAGKSRKIISRVFLESRLGKSIKSSLVEPVIEDIFASIQRNPHAFNGLMRCKRDNEYIYRHALAVSALMISLGRQMKLPADTIRQAGMAGLLMDVGIGMLPVDLSRYGGDYRNLAAEVLNQHIRLGPDFLYAGGGIPAALPDVVLNPQ